MKNKWIVIALAACAIALAGCKVVSEPEPIAVESVALNATTLTLAPGATKKLTATVKPDNADDKTVKWSSSDNDVVTVDKKGLVTAVSEGGATITAHAGEKMAVCEVIVEDPSDLVHPSVPVNSVWLDKPTLTLNCDIYEWDWLRAEVWPENADCSDMWWASENSDIATVDYYGKNCKVTALSEGRTNIYVYAGNEWAICEVSVKSKKVTIENGTINEWGVLTEYHGSESKVVIPEGVMRIGYGAFEGCTSLEIVDIAGGVIEIEARAFFGCENLKTVMISNSLTFISSGAFDGCTSLTTVTIPESVMSIRDDAFHGCDNLETVNYTGTLAQWCAMNNGRLAEYAKTVELNDVKDLKTMTNLDIPDGVTRIGDYAFHGCTCLETVMIPNSVENIGSYAFSECKNIKSVDIPGSVIRIGDYAFYGCDNLETVTILEGVTDIGFSAFEGCTSLTSIMIPKSLMYIGAFWECENLETVNYGGTLAQWCVMGNGGIAKYAMTVKMADVENLKTMTNLDIPEGVDIIGQYAFCGCENLETVTIPKSVKLIVGNAFDGCYNINAVAYGGTLEQWCAMDIDYCLILAETITIGGVTDLKSLSELVIPDSVTRIGHSAFMYCRNLESVIIPKSVTLIGVNAFYECNLTTVTYGGKKEDWRKIEILVSSGLKDKTIICTDGNETSWPVE